MEKLLNYLKDKKILILGFGLEGQSTYKFIRKYFKNKKIYIADKESKFYEKYSFLKDDKNLEYIYGEDYLKNLEEYDIIMKSPGISFVGIDISKFKDKIKSQLELLLQFFNIQTIGITGTKGKSTTSSLIYEVLKAQNKKCMLLGNIGVPIFDYIDKIEKDMTLVLEMSSHQLEYISVSPNISIVLNIYEEHLDHYESFEKYIEAKCNIFKNQSKENYFVYNANNDILKNYVNKCDIKSKIYKIDYNNTEKCMENTVYCKDDIVYLNNEKIYNCNDKRNLLGEHNLNNIMFVLAINDILKLNLTTTINTINNFKPLEHRLEKVGKFDGITYYNDSIATIPEATINSVNALKCVDSLIIGGMDRGINFDEFIKFLNESKVNNIICLPSTGHKIAERLNKNNIYIVNDLKEAVSVAKKVTQKGKICLLSPAASSYGFFKNFEERGNQFKKLVSK